MEHMAKTGTLTATLGEDSEELGPTRTFGAYRILSHKERMKMLWSDNLGTTADNA